MGGTGKTPMSLWLFNELILKHKKPCIITRGYGRLSKKLIIVNSNKTNYTADQIGDEPLMMLKSNKDMKMVIYNNKIKAIEAAINNLDVDIIILDDGFQSLYVDRDIDVVMINATQQKNAYRLFPVGLAREPIANIRRANMVITNRGIINSDINDFCIDNNINTSEADNIFQIIGEDNKVIDSFENLHSIAVCGIADPQSFLKALKNYKINVITEFIVADHYYYTARDINHIYQSMDENRCNTIITTWKDYCKIHPLNIKNKKIIILDMKLKIEDNALLSIIDATINEN
jgi:tetraacyldisaccharide 4'-kinase